MESTEERKREREREREGGKRGKIRSIRGGQWNPAVEMPCFIAFPKIYCREIATLGYLSIGQEVAAEGWGRKYRINNYYWLPVRDSGTRAIFATRYPCCRCFQAALVHVVAPGLVPPAESPRIVPTAAPFVFIPEKLKSLQVPPRPSVINPLSGVRIGK